MGTFLSAEHLLLELTGGSKMPYSRLGAVQNSLFEVWEPKILATVQIRLPKPAPSWHFLSCCGEQMCYIFLFHLWPIARVIGLLITNSVFHPSLFISFSKVYVTAPLKGHFKGSERPASSVNRKSRVEDGQVLWVCTVPLIWDHLGSFSKYFWSAVPLWL